MPKLTLAVRVAAGSILLFSLAHVLFWGILAFSTRANLPDTFPYNYFFPTLCVFSAAGLFGILIGFGILHARNWARLATLALAALIAFFCVFAILALAVLAFGSLSEGLGIEIPQKSALVRVGIIYLVVFLLAQWWIILFSRKSVSAQFASAATAPDKARLRAGCPRPIKLLAWLMILSSALSALSWPLILGKIPAMLFTHIFSVEGSKWIWVANIFLFLVCGIGLLKLQRWSYTGAIALHAFWFLSLFVSQVSPLYEPYLSNCMNLLELPQMYPGLSFPRFSPWVTAITSAIPEALLVAGLFYYRRSFLQAVHDSQRNGPKSATS